MNKKPKVDNRSLLSQRDLFMFVWLKSDRKTLPTIKELHGGNRTFLRREGDIDLFSPSPLEKYIRDNPLGVKRYIKSQGIDMRKWKVSCDEGYNAVAVESAPCIERKKYKKLVLKYEAKKAKERARKQKEPS